MRLRWCSDVGELRRRRLVLVMIRAKSSCAVTQQQRQAMAVGVVQACIAWCVGGGGSRPPTPLPSHHLWGAAARTMHEKFRLCGPPILINTTLNYYLGVKARGSVPHLDFVGQQSDAEERPLVRQCRRWRRHRGRVTPRSLQKHTLERR